MLSLKSFPHALPGPAPRERPRGGWGVARGLPGAGVAPAAPPGRPAGRGAAGARPGPAGPGVPAPSPGSRAARGGGDLALEVSRNV